MPNTAPTVQATSSKSVTAEGYDLEKGSEGYYHLNIEQIGWKTVLKDVTKGPEPVKTSYPFTVKYTEDEYRQFLENNPRLQFTVHAILHDPNPERTEKIKAEVEAMLSRRSPNKGN